MIILIIVITGPTGVGKTKLSIELAKEFNAEVINGDSVQVYKGLNIGSAKIKEEEKEGIIHHLFDIREVNEDYSIYDYQKDCRSKITEIIKKGKNVIIVGGTGLYIKSALYDYTLSDTVTRNNYDDVSTEELYSRLKNLDKDIEIDSHNRKRIIRALDYYLTNNKSIRTNKNGSKLLYDAIFIGLTTDRLELYERINNRVDEMIHDGLIDEVKTFYDKDIRSRILSSAIGYKEIYEYLDGNIDLTSAIELIKKNSRRYAKRQYTFFNHQFNMNWFSVNFSSFNSTIDEVKQFIKKNTSI